MKTQDFIEKHAAKIGKGEDAGYHVCSNVFVDGDTIYSYGRHYPLVWPVKSKSGKTLLCVNRSGYSRTTSKHIAWCAGVADIAIHTREWAGKQDTDAIIAVLEGEISAKRDAISAIKRAGTKKAEMLENDIKVIRSHLAKINK